MSSWRKLVLFTAFLPGAAIAADPAMLELIMPDAKCVVDVNIARLVSSPVGQAMSAQMKNELQNMRPDWQRPMMGLTGIDWTKYAQEVMFAAGPGAGKEVPGLIIVRGLLDPAWVESAQAFRGEKSTYQGVPLVATGNHSVVAFLDGGIALLGSAAEVKAAINRRGKNEPQSPALSEGLQRFDGQYDAWIVASGPLPSAKMVPAAVPGAQSAPGAPAAPVVPSAAKWPDRLQAMTAGVRLSPDLEITADLVMRSEKDVADMANGLKWFTGVVQAQAHSAANLDKMNFKVDGKRLSLAIEVPEREILAALQQRQTAQAPRVRAAARPPEIHSGLPDPPAGTIRVQSSPQDMGTVLVPLDKSH